MKNFNLLLATTAIMSTAAFMAIAADLTWSNYTNAGINIPINVKVVDPIKVAVEQGLDFGVAEFDSDDITKTVMVDTNGNVTGTATYFGGAKRGIVWYFPAVDNENIQMKLVFPTTPVVLYVNGLSQDGQCGTVSGFTQTRGAAVSSDQSGFNYKYPIYIGATYTSSRLDSHENDTSECEGSVTATLVYDNGATTSGN